MDISKGIKKQQQELSNLENLIKRMRKIRTQLRLRGGRITFFKYTKGSHKKKGDVLMS